jgi:hypothetical protein
VKQSTRNKIYRFVKDKDGFTKHIEKLDKLYEAYKKYSGKYVTFTLRHKCEIGDIYVSYPDGQVYDKILIDDHEKFDKFVRKFEDDMKKLFKRILDYIWKISSDLHKRNGFSDVFKNKVLGDNKYDDNDLPVVFSDFIIYAVFGFETSFGRDV